VVCTRQPLKHERPLDDRLQQRFPFCQMLQNLGVCDFFPRASSTHESRRTYHIGCCCRRGGGRFRRVVTLRLVGAVAGRARCISRVTIVVPMTVCERA